MPCVSLEPLLYQGDRALIHHNMEFNQTDANSYKPVKHVLFSSSGMWSQDRHMFNGDTCTATRYSFRALVVHPGAPWLYRTLVYLLYTLRRNSPCRALYAAKSSKWTRTKVCVFSLLVRTNISLARLKTYELLSAFVKIVGSVPRLWTGMRYVFNAWDLPQALQLFFFFGTTVVLFLYFYHRQQPSLTAQATVLCP